jgi:myo-inositol-1(or 4)-monophosphatase
MFETLSAEISQNLNHILSLRDDKILKDDNSYVSKGDIFVQEIIFKHCSKFYPQHIIISEELAFETIINWSEKGSYIIIDPIDGTENFVSGLKEWGIGISIYTDGMHISSFIYLPELDISLFTGQKIKKYNSRIIGISSSLLKEDLMNLPEFGFEFRIIGCSMYNMISCINGSFKSYENVKGVNCWDILPGLNLALEHGLTCFIDDKPYVGQILFPTKKYKVKLINN